MPSVQLCHVVCDTWRVVSMESFLLNLSVVVSSSVNVEEMVNLRCMRIYKKKSRLSHTRLGDRVGPEHFSFLCLCKTNILLYNSRVLCN